VAARDRLWPDLRDLPVGGVELHLRAADRHRRLARVGVGCRPPASRLEAGGGVHRGRGARRTHRSHDRRRGRRRSRRPGSRWPGRSRRWLGARCRRRWGRWRSGACRDARRHPCGGDQGVHPVPHRHRALLHREHSRGQERPLAEAVDVRVPVARTRRTKPVRRWSSRGS
jgi:hypothetical protein